MRRHILGFTAAIFVVNGMTGSRILAQSNLGEKQPGANTAVDRAAGPAAGAIADDGVTERNAVRDALAQAVSATLSGNLSDLAKVITDEDRQQLGSKLNDPDAQAVEKVAQFREAWKRKYNQEFEPKSGEIAFGSVDVRIVPRDISGEGSARIAGDRISSSTIRADETMAGNTSGGVAGADAKAANAADRPVASVGGIDNPDRKAANSVIAVLPSTGHLPDVHVTLIRQALGNEWKVDLPDGLTTEQIKMNIQRHMAMLLDDVQNWPTDIKAGYRMASYHALDALVGVNKPNSLLPARVAN